MKPTRPVNLILLGIAFLVVTYLIVRGSYATMSTMPTLAGVTLLVLAVVDAGLALALRPRFRRRAGTTVVQPMTAVRVLALAKSSSVLGAIMAGVWLGFGLYVFPRRAAVLVEHDVITSIIGLVSAGALITAALWLEYECRVRDDEDRA